MLNIYYLEDDGRYVLVVAIQRRRQFQFFACQGKDVGFAGTGDGQSDFASRFVAHNRQPFRPTTLIRF